MSTANFTVETIAIRELPEAVHRELHDATAALHDESTPDEPRNPVEQEIAQLRNLPDIADGAIILARDAGGAIAGFGNVSVQDIEGFRHVANIAVAVLPEQRRHGLGTVLLRAAVDVAAGHGKTLLLGSSRQNVPAGEAFARHLGAELGQVVTENRLDLQSLDRSLILAWLAEGPRRAPGYSLRFVDGPTPDDLAGEVIRVTEVMNTAPRDDLQLGDFRLTPELLQAQERMLAGAGMSHWAFYAVEDSSGRFVGLTDIVLNPETPDRVHIGNTGVDPAHRGHAIGKWLKAAMTLRVLDEAPATRWIVTGNAASNAPMLEINRRLGFRAAASIMTWQMSTEAARQALG